MKKKMKTPIALSLIRLRKRWIIEILPNDLGQSHRIENLKTKKKERLIIVKFVRYS